MSEIISTISNICLKLSQTLVIHICLTLSQTLVIYVWNFEPKAVFSWIGQFWEMPSKKFINVENENVDRLGKLMRF